MALVNTPPAEPKEVAHRHYSRHSQHQPADQTTVKTIYTKRRDAVLGVSVPQHSGFCGKRLPCVSYQQLSYKSIAAIQARFSIRRDLIIYLGDTKDDRCQDVTSISSRRSD